ncbi:PREDICTED: myb-like protein X [Dinoponera quadriceps]|uniref:Myb-like protein X n=1 Tax=Dinoponera quadriceps TaxID=609295 RepID=A0A6P3YHC9_DINQU|nr:PREDICTED: myb-like protein X [Dinoponera quadriceps]
MTVTSNYILTEKVLHLFCRVYYMNYRELRPRIEQLLTNDYQRIWWKEKQTWDERVAEKTPGKIILPRMLIKKKVPTCVTVKYRTQRDRWKGRKKQDSKSNLKTEEIKQESTMNDSNEEELKSVEDNNGKLEKCEETKSEKLNETQLESENEKEDESKEESEGEKYEETKSEKYKETQSENEKEKEDESKEEGEGESHID